MDKKLQKLLNRADALKDSKNYNEIINLLTQIIKLAKEDNTKSTAFNHRGNAYNNKGEYDKAITDHTYAIKLEPNYADAFCGRGFAYGNKGEYDQALADFNRSIELNPNDANAFYNRGITYRKLEQEEKALKDFKKTQRLDPTVIPREDAKEIKKAVKKTQDFQEILEKLKKEYRSAETKWFRASIIISVLTIGAFVYLSICVKSTPYPLYLLFINA